MAPEEIAAWRRDRRERLLRHRKNLPSAERTALARPMLVNLSILLKTLELRTLGIGLGFEFSRLEGFVAQPHDIPMSAIVTEAAIRMPGRPHHEAVYAYS